MNATDAIAEVTNLRRTLQMARAAADREALHGGLLPGLKSDVVEALAQRLQAAEQEAVRLVGDGYKTTCGGFISATVDDRRRHPRPRFTYRRSDFYAPRRPAMHHLDRSA